MSHAKTVSVIYSDGETAYRLIGPVALSMVEVRLLNCELDLYNKQIDDLRLGEADVSSYDDPEDKRMLSEIADGRGHSPVDGKALYPRAYYGDGNTAHFWIVNSDLEDDELKGELIFSDYGAEYSDTLDWSASKVYELFTAPYASGETFSLGYKIWPLTRGLIMGDRRFP